MFDAIPRYDTLSLYDKSLQVRQLIGDDETIFYSCAIPKFNRYGLQEDRHIVVSSEHLWTLEQGSLNYTEHRKLAIVTIDAFTTSTDGYELVVHCGKDYDERFNCVTAEHMHNLSSVLKAIIVARGSAYKTFQVNESKLRKFTTLKTDSDKQNYKRPDES